MHEFVTVARDRDARDSASLITPPPPPFCLSVCLSVCLSLSLSPSLSLFFSLSLSLSFPLLSQIAVVAVMAKPHRCPHIAMTGNVCVYCPGGPDSDFEYSTQSYTGCAHQSIYISDFLKIFLLQRCVWAAG